MYICRYYYMDLEKYSGKLGFVSFWKQNEAKILIDDILSFVLQD